MKYEGPNSYQTKDVANVKVFADKQMDKWMGQKLYAPIYQCEGINMNYLKLKIISFISIENLSSASRVFSNSNFQGKTLE